MLCQFLRQRRHPESRRYDMLKSHLITRAAENIMTVVSTNTASGYPTAPTMVVTQDGSIAKEAPVGCAHDLRLYGSRTLLGNGGTTDQQQLFFEYLMEEGGAPFFAQVSYRQNESIHQFNRRYMLPALESAGRAFRGSYSEADSKRLKRHVKEPCLTAGLSFYFGQATDGKGGNRL